MKALFIMPYNCDLIHAVSVPMGILSIATYLKSNGYDVKICDMSVSHVNIENVFDEYSPNIVGISLPSVKHLDGAMEVSKKLHKKGVPIVWGGTFCDIADENLLLSYKNVDCLSFKEGEATWLEIMQSLESGIGFENIPGIAFRDDAGNVIITPERAYIDLTSLPILDFSLVDVKKYSQYLYGCKNLIYVYLSKGCPSHCTFCANQITHKCTYRRRSLEHFMKETEILVNEYGVDGLYFGDEICFLTKDQVYEVCDAFDKSGLKFHWGFQTRIGVLSKAEIQRCYDSGCRWIDFGIESGNKEQLNMMKKAIPYEEIIPTFDWCSEIGIISLANFIVGLPGETEAQLKDTINLANKINSTQCSFFQYCISPKTEMGKKAIDEYKFKYPVKKITDYKKIDFFLSKTDNYSYINKRDLEIIQSYYLWQAIFRKDYSEGTKNYDLFVKHIFTLFKRISFLSIPKAVPCLFEFAFLCFRFFFDTKFCTGTLKKYGLKQ